MVCANAVAVEKIMELILDGFDKSHHTPHMTPSQTLSAKILAFVAEGYTIREAFDMVLGEGAFLEFAGNLYDALNKR